MLLPTTRPVHSLLHRQDGLRPPECDAVEGGGTGYASCHAADIRSGMSMTMAMVPVTRAAAHDCEPASVRIMPCEPLLLCDCLLLRVIAWDPLTSLCAV
eukprot:3445980-Prymnesium_polylepis.1